MIFSRRWEIARSIWCWLTIGCRSTTGARAGSGAGAPARHPVHPGVGHDGEEVAVESLKGGATDYVLKTRLDRLGPCVRRALQEAEETRRRKAAEAALRESNRRKSEFLAMLSHELRNPLAAIHHAISVWKESDDRPRAPRGHAGDRASGTQLARMLDDLLDVTRISRGRIDLHPERMDAAIALDHAAEAIRPLFLGRRHELIPPTSMAR